MPMLVFAAPADVGIQKETSAPLAESATVQKLFSQFGLFGRWAIDCKQPARPDNPHVHIIMPSAELVMENHDLGPDYAINRYSVLSAERISATRLSVEALFQPGTENEERQKLVFLVRNGTRRTLFNQPDEGPVRVKDGIALPRGVKTPLLMKCE
jgi:hypothetical protein